MIAITVSTVPLFISSSPSSDNAQPRQRHRVSSLSPIHKPFSSSFNSERFRIRAIEEKTEETQNPSSSSSSPSSSAEDITKKYGLDAGLWKVIILVLQPKPTTNTTFFINKMAFFFAGSFTR